MGATLGEIVTRIKSEAVITTTVHDENIRNAVRSAIRQLQTGAQFWFLETKANVALVTNSDEASLPADFGAIQFVGAVLIDGDIRYGNKNGFKKISITELVTQYRSYVFTQRPCVWAINGQTITTDAKADKDYTIELWYYRKDPVLPVFDADTSIWLEDEPYDATRSLAMAIFKKDSLEYPLDKVSADFSMANNYINKLTSQHNLRGAL
jgi:hypothetical protein